METPKAWGEGCPLHSRPLAAGGAERRIGKDCGGGGGAATGVRLFPKPYRDTA
jgi:hypothetical protein